MFPSPSLLSLALVLLVATGTARANSHSASSSDTRPQSQAQRQGPPPWSPVLAPASLPTPYCWSCSGHRNSKPLGFQFDLDLLAPLGEGEANAATWLALFARGGPRLHELDSIQLIEAELAGRRVRAYPPDHPLLREAEGWVESARCSFYPEIWTPNGWPTELPNLLFARRLAHSWLARASQADTPAAARADIQRAVRLGRLLLQDDVTLPQNLVGLSIVRLGAQALFSHARSQGAATDMAAAALALQDATAIHLLSMDLAEALGLAEHTRRGLWGVSVELPQGQFGQLMSLATEARSRALRLEALKSLQVVAQHGRGAQRDAAGELLERMTTAPDPLAAQAALAMSEQRLSADELESLVH